MRKHHIMKKMLLLLMLCLTVTTVTPCSVHAKTQTVTSGDQKKDKKARAIIKKVITTKMSTAEKVKAIHDYIALNCAYDYANYLRGTIPSDSYTARGVLFKKTAVCQGYAEAFKLFMDMLGIPCKLVTGTANNGGGYGGHAWNIVKVGGKWYHIDVTWDDPVPDEKGLVRYNYFLLSDSQIDDDHKWNRSAYKKCTTDNANVFIKLIGDAAETMDEAIDTFYTDYTANKGKQSTIIINKELFDSQFFYHLTDGLSERYGIRFYGCRHTHPAAYGNYYIIRYFDFGS